MKHDLTQRQDDLLWCDVEDVPTDFCEDDTRCENGCVCNVSDPDILDHYYGFYMKSHRPDLEANVVDQKEVMAMAVRAARDEENDPTYYAIRSTVDPTDWWSSELGWTYHVPSRDIFTAQDRRTLNLPMDGEWVEADPGAGEFDEEFPDEHSHVPQEVDPGVVGLHAQDSEGRHYYLQIHTNDDGIVIDVYDRYGDEVHATFARTYNELVDFVFANDPGATPSCSACGETNYTGPEECTFCEDKKDVPDCGDPGPDCDEHQGRCD